MLPETSDRGPLQLVANVILCGMATTRIHRPISIGDTRGRWTVLASEPSKFYGVRERRMWRCRCTCGIERVVQDPSLRNGASQSCGCLNRERSSWRHKTHGESHKSREYQTWKAMLARCYNPGDPRFEDYGGRGIKVCDRWRRDFPAFLADMGRRPLGCSIERENNDLGYGPDNCRWATSAEQMVNRRNTRTVDYHGEIVPLATLAKRFKIPANTLRFRVLANWDIDEALSLPVRPKAPNNSRRR